MLLSRSARGSRVQTPCGPRKSGMPESVLMPAPVSATNRRASVTQRRTSSTSRASAQMGEHLVVHGAPDPAQARVADLRIGERADERHMDAALPGDVATVGALPTRRPPPA